MTAQPASHVTSKGAATRLVPSKLEILEALHSERHAQHWTDEWTTDSKGRFMVVSHKIRVELPSPQPWAGHVHAIRISYEEIDLNSSKLRNMPNDFQLHFQPLGSAGVSWNISRAEFEVLKQQHEWIKERSEDRDA
jgi:hypothetical protein